MVITSKLISVSVTQLTIFSFLVGAALGPLLTGIISPTVSQLLIVHYETSPN